jgi:predicted DCC family thiol-disulfide oxidoreductase YuxK
MITVYYDGICGVCSREINYYKKIAGCNKFIWLDITKSPKKLEAYGYSLEQGLKELHAKDEKDKFYIGVDAFILIWKNLPYWKLLSKVVSLPIFYQIAKFAYSKFANYRFNNLEHCNLSKNSDTKPSCKDKVE